MPNNPSGPLRRAQLISPFGVGAMVIVPGGTSLVIGGLDYWFKQSDGKTDIDLDEFCFDEWRLKTILGVSHFRIPPDHRYRSREQDVPNLGITIPAFRFPTWHFCSDKSCRLLYKWPLFTRGTRGRIKCPECASKKKTRYMFQVPFVAMCDRGHLQDFPWREWVHHELNPRCEGTLRLISTGSASLVGQKVRCDACGKERTLAGITTAHVSGNTSKTTLSSNLADGMEFLCQGIRPWLGPGSEESCNAQLRASLRSASNLYFVNIYSSIYLPRIKDIELQKIENLLQSTPLSSLLTQLRSLGQLEPEENAKTLKNSYSRLLSDYSINQIANVIKELVIPGTSTDQHELDSENQEDPMISFRHAEYSALRTERHDQELRIKKVDSSLFENDITKFFSRVMLVTKLRETRVMAGFSRIYPENDQDNARQQAMLWKIIPQSDRWLPAYIVFGEGIYFEFDENLLSRWENQRSVISRVKPLLDRYKIAQERKHLQERSLGARFVLLHTFAHLVINRMTFECGYSSAALRERLYVSSNPATPMSGVLIYTADGDSEGTMGGLVRMGRPGNIEPVIRRAIEGARWCSADPVCMEMGRLNGQGPDSCNLAACHNCALIPETACEEFNRFLDRGVIIGDLGDPSIGYFNS